jgi:hypothetical protein
MANKDGLRWKFEATHCDPHCVNIYILLTVHILRTMTTALTVKEEIRILKLECISDIDRALAHNIDPLFT